mgnify:CR=1 FL=1
MDNDLYNINPKEFKILDRQEYDQNVQYVLEAVSKPTECPVCGSDNFIGKGVNPRKARDMNEYDKLVGLIVNTHRYVCKNCGNTWSDTFESLPPNAKITKRLRDYICDRALYVPFSDIKRDIDISVSTVKRIFHDHVEELDDKHEIIAPEVLGLDETMLQGKYRGMYVDIKGGRIIDMTEDRKKQTVVKWLNNLPQKERIKCVTIDMWGDYKDAVQAVLPRVPIVVDKFHVFEHIYKDFNDIRIRLSKNLTSKEKAIIKGNWRLLSYNAVNLDFKGQQKLKEILDNIPIFKEPHSIKENFADIYNARTRKEGEYLFEEWVKRASQYEEFTDSIAMIYRWHEYIFNWYDHNVTNATTEALNRLAKEIAAKGRGYTYDVLKAKILYGTTAAKPAKFEYRPVKGNVVGFTSKKNRYEIGYASMWRHDDNEKVIVAVPGVDIEEIIQVITREGKL